MNPKLFNESSQGRLEAIDGGLFAFVPDPLPSGAVFPDRLWPLLAEVKQRLGPQIWADSVAAYRLTEDTERMAKTQPNDRSASMLRMSVPRDKPCAIYTRQSRIANSSLASNDVQRGVCQDFAWARGWLVLEERFDDLGESSETLDRPALKRLLQLIEQGRVAQVVVASVDRLTRRLFHLQKLLETFSVHDVELGVVCDPHYGETAGNRLMANIVAAASEFQQEMTRERMTESRKALKSKGRRVAGRVPFGFDTHLETKQLVLNPHEAEQVRTMFEMAAAGKRPQEISDFANSQGWQTRSGRGKTGAWTARQILKVLANPIYTGSIRNGDGTLPGIHEAIVTVDLFQQVREVIQSRRSRSPGREKPSESCALQGRITCAKCGRLMSPSSSGYKNLRYRYYRCRSRSGGRPPCTGVCVSAFQIEEFIRDTLCRDEWEGMEVNGLSQDFCRAWARLADATQFQLLKEVLSDVVFDPVDGAVTLKFVEDAASKLPK